jgi:hypothetical protein
MTTTTSARGAVQLSSSKGVPTSQANASLTAGKGPEPSGLASVCKAQAGAMSRRSVLMNVLVSTAAVASASSISVADDLGLGSRATLDSDPIFEAIKAHEDAEVACNEAQREIDRLLKAADDAGFPHAIQVLDYRNPPICLYAPADSISDINELVPGDEREELRQHYYRKRSERNQERAAFWGFNPDDLMSEAAEAEWHALRHFAEIVPITLAGLLAKLSYAGKLADDADYDRFDDVDITQVLLNSLATAARSFAAQEMTVSTANVPAASTASSGPNDSDPIFALIEVHRTKRQMVPDLLKRRSKLERALPAERRRSSVDAFEEKICETDDPQWIEVERALNSAYEAEEDAALRLIAEPPATIQGAKALLQYVAEVEVDRCSLSWPDSLQDDDGGGPKFGRDWAYYFHKNLAATFAAHAA